jgi:hypothetical protein
MGASRFMERPGVPTFSPLRLDLRLSSHCSRIALAGSQFSEPDALFVLKMVHDRKGMKSESRVSLLNFALGGIVLRIRAYGR